jgi:hypothetical protein
MVACLFLRQAQLRERLGHDREATAGHPFGHWPDGGLTGPFLESMSMPVLGRLDGREIVLGQVAKFWQPRPSRASRQAEDAAAFTAFAKPGWAKGALSLQLAPMETGTELAAETRVQATDERSRRVFGLYWAFIRLGGAGFIRLELLGAIAVARKGWLGGHT